MFIFISHSILGISDDYAEGIKTECHSVAPLGQLFFESKYYAQTIYTYTPRVTTVATVLEMEEQSVILYRFN